MKEDKMAVTRGAGSQRTHCLEVEMTHLDKEKTNIRKGVRTIRHLTVGVVGVRICY